MMTLETFVETQGWGMKSPVVEAVVKPTWEAASMCPDPDAELTEAQAVELAWRVEKIINLRDITHASDGDIGHAIARILARVRNG